MKEVTIFTDDRSPESIRVFAIGDTDKPTSLVYPDWPSFLADGRRFVMYTDDGPTICDPDDDCALRPIFPGFNEKNYRTFRVSPDGRYAFFRNDAASKEPSSLTISRVDLSNLQVEDVYHSHGGKLPGTDVPIHRMSFDTVSADNRRTAGVCRLDSNTQNALFGLFALDLDTSEFHTVWIGPFFNNAHLRYCLSPDPDAAHDLLVQMNHGARYDEKGTMLASLGPPADKGIDIHVIRDDGTNRRDLPFGRDGLESCIGHQVWRGQHSRSVVTISLQNKDISYGWADGSNQDILAGEQSPVDMDAPHLGRLTPGAQRVTLSQGFDKPRFNHLSCDASGMTFAFDTFPIFDGERAGMQIYTGKADNTTEPLHLQYILNSGVTLNNSNGYHSHPVIAPDGSFLLFNSNLSGTKQAYMVTGI
ncbi:MAG: hypothetical protein K9N51_09475 [Candidatus Pacebacteria bacterium]|nr:hypothetical protein [Candidatus Paceibacterota bacterium]